MSKMTYSEQLRHPNWQRKRLEMLDAYGWECSSCGGKETTLHVHHKRYVKGRMAWEYDGDELAVLCEPCHEEAHAIDSELKALLFHIDNTDALALLRGFHVHADWFDPWIGDIGRDRNPHLWALGVLAYLCTGLSPKKQLQVADFAASLQGPDQEERLVYEDHRGIFDELG